MAKRIMGQGTKLEDDHCHDVPALAFADGTVRSVYDGASDMPIGQPSGRPAGDNQVVIEVAPNQFFFSLSRQTRVNRREGGRTGGQWSTCGYD